MKNITKNSIALKYRNALVLNESALVPTPASLTLAMEMLQLGFIASGELVDGFSALTSEQIAAVRSELIENLRAMKGADVKYTPMYPNFPQQVAEASDIELFLNAILHYWTRGEWSPKYDVLPREYAEETNKLIEIGVIDTEEFHNILGELMSSNESLSEGDKETIVWFMDNDWPDKFVMFSDFKENTCFVAGELLKRDRDITGVAQTVTDVLRVAVALNDGDVSLASDTKFKSLPRKTRRILTNAIEQVILTGSGSHLEDINRHRGKWVTLFHNLHVGEYSKLVYAVAKKIRNNEKIATFNSCVQSYIDTGDIAALLDTLKTRPGEFARRLDLLLRKFDNKQSIICRVFGSVVDKINTRGLLQLYGHTKTRFYDTEKRVAFPKGNTQRALLLSGQEALNHATLLKVQSSIRSELISRFGKLETLGSTWIDPALKECPVPTQQRSASEGLFQVARGTRLPIGDDKTTLRFFIYWKGRDIDLSATFYDENFEDLGHISYTRLRSAEYKAYHSGDIVNGSRGASEFIDVSIDASVAAGVRYIAMNVLVFAGPTFAEHEICYAGWMTREKSNSNEIYEPKTVEQKIDLRSNTKNSIPVIFDLVERKAIWADMSTSTSYQYYGNNVESNRASIIDTTEAIIDNSNKVSLFELFTLHGLGRGGIVENKEEADTVFSFTEGVTPYDISVINSEYVS